MSLLVAHRYNIIVFFEFLPLLGQQIFCVTLYLLFELFDLRFLLWSLYGPLNVNLAALVEIIVVKAVQGHEFVAPLGVMLAHKVRRLPTMHLSDLADMLLLDGTAQKSTDDFERGLIVFSRVHAILAPGLLNVKPVALLRRNLGALPSHFQSADTAVVLGIARRPQLMNN